MPILNTNEYRGLLEDKHKDLLSTSSNRDEIAIETAADEMDRLQQQLNREVVIRRLDRTSKLLRSVKAALDRIEDDIYGVCLRCEEPIAEKRLKAIPWAPYCVACQETIDRSRAHPDEDDGVIEFAA